LPLLVSIGVGSEPHTVYADIRDLPSPVQLGLRIVVTNQLGGTRYIQAQLSGGVAGQWTHNAQNLGSLADGTSAIYVIHNFSQRTSPPSPTELTNGEGEETLTLHVRAYTDSGYTNLDAEETLDFNLVWLDSEHSSWTVLDTDDFETDTEGWSAYNTTPKVVTAFDRQSDVAVHGTYCLRIYGDYSGDVNYREGNWGMQKTFTIPVATKVFAILHTRARVYSAQYDNIAGMTGLYVDVDGTAVWRNHKGWVYAPANSWVTEWWYWHKVVIKIEGSGDKTIRVYAHVNHPATSPAYRWDTRLDWVKIIYK